jgi:hypothetical protein
MDIRIVYTVSGHNQAVCTVAGHVHLPEDSERASLPEKGVSEIEITQPF